MTTPNGVYVPASALLIGACTLPLLTALDMGVGGAHGPIAGGLATATVLSAAALAWRAALQRVRPAAAVPTPKASDPLSQFRAARRDPISSVANRRIFDTGLADRLASMPCALLLVDINDFGRINDDFGFDAGDAILRQTAERMAAAVSDRNAVAHLFSDQFGIFTSGLELTDEVPALVLRLLGALEAPFAVETLSVPITVSIGIAYAPEHGHDVAALMLSATHALREAKAASRDVGHSRWIVYDQDSASVTNSALRMALPQAIATRQIVPYYQPIIDLISMQIASFEVLARWNHPNLGLLLPEMFIGLADEEEQLSAITRSLLEQVARDARDWPDDFSFAFNVAPNQLRDLIAFARTQAESPSLPARRIEVEITEGALIKDLEATREAVHVLGRRGIPVVLDDFGAGFGNYHHLHEIPFNRLKIDKSFVMNMLGDKRAEACLRSMVEAGRLLDMDVTAEGVSSPEIAARVTAMGCRFGQGSLFSMPVPADEVPALLNRLRCARSKLAA